jgi:hypothetical protein
MKNSKSAALLLAFLTSAPAWATVQHLYCRSPEEYSTYQVSAVVVDDTHLDQVFVITGNPNGEPIVTEIGAVTGSRALNQNRFDLQGSTLRLPSNLTQLDYKKVDGMLQITDEMFPLACFVNTSL